MHLPRLSIAFTAILLMSLPFFVHPKRLLGQLWKQLRRRYTKKGRRARGYGSNY